MASTTEGSGARPGPFSRASGLLARVVAVGIVVAFGAWVARVAPVAFDGHSFPVGIVAYNLLQGQSFPQSALDEIDADVKGIAARDLCIAADMKNATVVRAAAVDEQFAIGSPRGAEAALMASEESAKRALACDPNSSWAWMVLSWTEFLRNDLTPRMIEYARMSYRTGPYEGWTLLRRSQILIQIISRTTDPDLRDILRHDVQKLIADEIFLIVANMYLSADAAGQALLVEIFSEADANAQKAIASYIYRAGGDIQLPLGPARGTRPWDG